MGKNNLILGTARGKLGDVVFYRTGGEQRFRTRVRPTNPRSNAQLLQRCVVSTAVKFYSAVANICNHAFQNYEGSLKNHQRFMKLNIDMLRKIALENIYSWSPLEYQTPYKGNFTEKDSTDVMINPYIISEGDLPEVESSVIKINNYERIILATSTNKWDTWTYRDVANMLGVNIGDQITILYFNINPDSAVVDSVVYGRIIINPSNGNANELFFTSGRNINLPNRENEGNVTFDHLGGTEQDADSYLAISIRGVTNTLAQRAAWGIITSRFENSKWRRSTSTIKMNGNITALNVLPVAIDSYKKTLSSSLYLNQADDFEFTENVLEEVAETYANNEEIEQEEKKRKRKE